MTYQPFFDQVDTIVPLLHGEDELSKEDRAKAADLLTRATYVVVQVLNASISSYPHLVLHPEGTEATSETPPEDPVLPNPS